MKYQRHSFPIGPLLMVGFCLAACGNALSQAAINVRLSDSEIFVGEATRMTITITGATGVRQPVIPEIDGVDIRYLGNTSQRFAQATYAFTYEVIPREEKTYHIGPIKAPTRGKRLSHEGVTLRGIGSRQDSDVLLHLQSTHETVMVGDPFRLTFKVLAKRLSGRYQNSDPIVGERSPHLGISFLQDVPEGLVGPDIRPILQRALVHSPKAAGFRINNFTVGNDQMSIFGLDPLSRSKPARFMLTRKSVRQNNINFFEYSMSLEYRPEVEGRYSFDAPTFKGHLVTSAAQGGLVKTRPVFVTGDPLVVTVLPPPAEGRPASFIGAVGSNLNVHAELSTQTCHVGDPLTLTLVVDGDISFKNIDPPAIGEQDALTRRFRVYQDSVQTETGERSAIYRYTIKPIEAGTYELPPIDVAYYDRQSRQYKVAQTEPIPIRAIKTAEVAGDWVVNGTTNGPAQFQLSNGVNKKPAPMTVVRSGAEREKIFAGTRHIPIALLGPMFLALIGIVRVMRFASRRITTGGTQRGAASRTRQALDALDLDQDPSDTAGQLRDLMAIYLKDRIKLDRLPQTPEDVYARLRSHPAIPEDTCERFAKTFGRAFNGQFKRPSRDEIAALCTETSEGISALERSMTRPPRTRSTAAIVLLLCSLAPAQASEVSMEHQFMWDEANSALSRSRTVPEFSQAATLYRRMLSSGVVSGPVLYNLGVAELNAEGYDKALGAFQRAERYMGSSAEITRNMTLATAAGEDMRPATLSWLRAPLFWHYALPGSVRCSIAAAAFSLCCLSLFLWISGAKAISRPLLTLSALVFAVFGTSAGTTIAMEHSAGRRDALPLRQADNALPGAQTLDTDQPQGHPSS